MKVVLAGGSGSLGRRIAADLAPGGHDVVVLTRRVNPALDIRQVPWDGRTLGDWAAELDGANTAVINLAGKLVDCRPTPRNIAELRGSRVLATRALVEASTQLKSPLAHWIQASTTAIWSDAGETRCDETTPLPTGLPQMTGVAKPWEQAFAGANTRHGVILRTAVVLDPDSPALTRLVGLTKYGLGGRVGTGRQWFSWIHLSDWLAIVRACLGLTPGVTMPAGVLVAAADHPVRNRELMATLRRQLHRPAAPPTPAALVKLGAAVLRTDPALGLTGRHATSTVLRDTGFEFMFPTLDAALADLLS
ncbi:NAD-dependent dehydratase [Mycobacterium sp. 852002-51163_SCH5372311]|nr:NAD-dependent dehydratase [Mycobacterium sp. 852002-51163_SCH5372311]